MEYAHEELIRELEISLSQLPVEIKKRITSFNLKKRVTKNPDAIGGFNAVSEDLADDITVWHYANSNDSDEDEYEDEYEEEYEDEYEDDVVVPVLKPDNTKVIETKEDELTEKKNSGWGINLDW